MYSRVKRIVICRQKRVSQRECKLGYCGSDVLLTNRYRGSPVCAATAADIPAAIFFVYETLSRPMSVASSAQFSSFNSALVPIFRRIHFYLNNYFVLLYSVVATFSRYLGVLVLIFFFVSGR